MDEPKEPASGEREEHAQTADVVAPDLEQARSDWMAAEQRQRKRILLWVVGGAAFVVVAFAVWWLVFKLPSIPVGCEAAILRLQTHCKLSRRQAINKLKQTPALVPGDPTRRETCRVLATAEHDFWRPRAIKALLGQVKDAPRGRPRPGVRPDHEPEQGRPLSEARPEAGSVGQEARKPDLLRAAGSREPGKGRPAAGDEQTTVRAGQPVAGKSGARSEAVLPESPSTKEKQPMGKIPVPAVIKVDGPLSDSARIFIENKLVPALIKKTYCPGRR